MTKKCEFGDFQTPENLARLVVKTLKSRHKVNPDLIIEPTCGTGAFIRSSLEEFPSSHIIGIDINQDYIQETRQSIATKKNWGHILLEAENFFEANWINYLNRRSGELLILGNPPWVTSSDLSSLGSLNTPHKSNFQNRCGIEAITGASNFDISEWMILEYLKWLSNRLGTIAVLCKYSVARKIISHIQNQKNRYLNYSSVLYLIDAKAYFNASVQGCFAIFSNQIEQPCTETYVYENLDKNRPLYNLKLTDKFIIRDQDKYSRWHVLAHQSSKHQSSKYLWRTGLKHDCAKVMELEKIDHNWYKNGLNSVHSLDETYVYPLLKGSDVGNGRVKSCRKFVVVPQKYVGEDTISIQGKSPNTWAYLIEHEIYLKNRKSSIYKNKPRFSIFGIGDYSFKPWKIAISGLYKRLNFCLLGPIDQRPVMVDDTVNIVSFDTVEEAQMIFDLLTSPPALEFLESLIFWDEKRPITTRILNHLSLRSIAQELGYEERYHYWNPDDWVNP